MDWNPNKGGRPGSETRVDQVQTAGHQGQRGQPIKPAVARVLKRRGKQQQPGGGAAVETRTANSESRANRAANREYLRKSERLKPEASDHGVRGHRLDTYERGRHRPE